LNAVGNRFVFDDIGFRQFIAAFQAFERHRPAHYPAIDFGQRHVHGDIAGAEAAFGVVPVVLIAAGKHHL
jgi:hypothetical protein